MDPIGQSRIPAHTRRQAMDWALVLMSQGIEATIDDGTDGTGSSLWVETVEHPKAIQAIKLYCLENRHWRWRQPVPWLCSLFDWKINFWSLFVIVFYTLSHTTRPDLQMHWLVWT